MPADFFLITDKIMLEKSAQKKIRHKLLDQKLHCSTSANAKEHGHASRQKQY